VPEPFYMASVIYGDADGEWAGGQNPLEDPGRVDFWRMNAERIEGEGFFPSPGGLTVPSPLVLEAVTAVGLSFRGTAADLRSTLGIDPDGVVGTVATPVPLIDLAAADVGLEIAIGAALVGGPTRRSVMVGMAALAACAGSGPDGPPKTLPTGDTASPTTDTGSALDCEDGGRVAWPRRTDEIPEALDLVDTHAAGTRGAGKVVAVVDSGVAPPPGATWLVAEAVGGLDATSDEVGHGTAVIEHLRAAAPQVQVRSIKCVDASGWANFPVAGFQRAVDVSRRRPDVVLCSWVLLELSFALQREIASAVARNIVVVFAAGNGTMRDVDPAEANPVVTIDQTSTQPVEISNASYGTRSVHAVAHPDALVVGGMAAYCNDDALDEDTVATAYDSAVFGADGLVDGGRELGGVSWDGARAVPDVCGLAAPPPVEPGRPPALTRTRTSPGSTLDRKPDGTDPDDGEALTAGSSMAAAHVAGVVALLRQAAPMLSVRGVKNVLMSTASNAGWRPRTGWGLVRASTSVPAGERPSALTWLVSGAAGYLRATLPDLGLPGPRPVDVDDAGLPRCPDLFFRYTDAEPNLQTRFGLTAKHVPGVLLAAAGRDDPRVLHVRVTNRGLADYSAVALVFLVTVTDDPDVFRVGGFEERDVEAGPGEFVVWPLVPVPDAVAVLVELFDSDPILTDGEYTRQELVALVADNPTVGGIAVPGGA